MRVPRLEVWQAAVQICAALPSFCKAFIEDLVGRSQDLNATRLPTYLHFVPAGVASFRCSSSGGQSLTLLIHYDL